MGFKQTVPYSSLHFCYTKSLVNPHISNFTVTVSAIEFWMWTDRRTYRTKLISSFVSSVQTSTSLPKCLIRPKLCFTIRPIRHSDINNITQNWSKFVGNLRTFRSVEAVREMTCWPGQIMCTGYWTGGRWRQIVDPAVNKKLVRQWQVLFAQDIRTVVFQLHDGL